jgi:adenosylmethionine-8-amino-7-oxononanoate transaminase
MSQPDTLRLAAADHRYLWHPFTQMQSWMAQEPLIIERAEGNYLIDTQGRRYLDGVASLWCNVHGHRKPALDRALMEQSAKVAHSTMLGLANVPAIELAERLIGLAPKSLARVFYSDSGAEAVEVALRMAAEYWHHRGQPQRTRFVTLTDSYHGDTLGAVSLGYNPLFHRPLRGLLFEALKLHSPHVLRFFQGMEAQAAEDEAIRLARQLFEREGERIAALIVEPLMQGAAGMWAHSARFLSELAALAREAGALIVADEVATGFGRTGAMFACDHAGLQPDLMCLGKGLTGGYLPMAATLASEQVFTAFLGRPEERRTFYYGHTYTGNPLAAAVALANLKVFDEERTVARVAPVAQHLGRGLSRFAAHRHVADIRQWGLMAGVELMEVPHLRQCFAPEAQVGARIAMAARRAGVIVRPLADVLVFMPALSIDTTQIDLLLNAVYDATIEIVG